jgi:hypothetical protein
MPQNPWFAYLQEVDPETGEELSERRYMRVFPVVQDRPGHRPSRPVDPGFGQRPGGRPGHLPAGRERPDRPDRPDRPPWERPERPEIAWPPELTDPDWGIDAGEHPDHPIYLPLEPGQELPPVEGHPPPVDPPPGTIWPPLPPDAPKGKHAFLIWISGVGLRYGVLENKDLEDLAGQLPAAGERPPPPATPLPAPGRPIPGQPLPTRR